MKERSEEKRKNHQKDAGHPSVFDSETTSSLVHLILYIILAYIVQ